MLHHHVYAACIMSPTMARASRELTKQIIECESFYKKKKKRTQTTTVSPAFCNGASVQQPGAAYLPPSAAASGLRRSTPTVMASQPTTDWSTRIKPQYHSVPVPATYTVPLYCTTSALYTFSHKVSTNHKSRLRRPHLSPLRSMWS